MARDHVAGSTDSPSSITEGRTEQDDSKRRKRKGGTDVALPARKPSSSPPPIAIRKENYYPLVQDYLAWVERRNRTPKTVHNYKQALEDFARYARQQGIALNVKDLTREHINAYVTDQFQNRRLAANSVTKHLKALRQFLNWCVEEGELTRSPAARVMLPMVPDEPPQMFTMGELKKLLATCERGRDFNSVRDYAVMRLLLSVGIRRGELANIRCDDFKRDEREVTVYGKGRRHRTINYGRKADDALRRYRRARERYRDGTFAEDPHIWIGQQGALTHGGLYQIVRRRAIEARLDITNPHAFRHMASHLWLKSGKSEGGLMRRMGWKSRGMIDRYGAGMAEERSRDEYKRETPDDDI